MDEIDKKAVQAATDPRLLNEFLQQNESLILRYTSSVVRRYITKSDDEFMAALVAFSNAVKSYSPEKGSFLAFSKLVIRRRLIDYIRSQQKTDSEVPVSPSVMDSEEEEDDEEPKDIAAHKAVYNHIEEQPDDSLKLEIEAAGQLFSDYEFSFWDLTSCSPKAEKTKTACAKAIIYILKNPIILNEMRQTKLLPLKLIEKNAEIPRKILERHRKYIIAAAEILTGDFPFLADYLQYIKKELKV
ncbi:MAG TPA: sigma-70 family RNA polymerase sigma factor [Caproicibacter sp.]|nr:sigma-70 family RNA polymerase sigma factor [Caproicibacter sp.]